MPVIDQSSRHTPCAVAPLPQASPADDVAAVLELVEHILAAATAKQAAQILATKLADHLSCAQVAIGLCRGNRGRCRLMAVSHLAGLDSNSPQAQSLEAACEEAILLDTTTVLSSKDDQTPPGVLAHRRLMTPERPCLVSMPLRDGEGVAIGAVIALDDGPLEQAQRFLSAAERPLALALAHAGGRRRFPLRRPIARLLAAGLLLALAALAIPVPYRISCDCQIEPVTRRLVTAPFEGCLEKSLVKPGDLVAAGDLLARLDPREVRWKLAELEADRSQAIKKRDAAQAARNYADAQIAALEAQRLELEIQLWQHRADNLQIRSPIVGVVASGDLQRVEGAPVKTGQTLFEIAPLESMLIEVSVPDEQIAHLCEGQTVTIRLDAYPGEPWSSTLTQIQPRAEIRDHENVFLAEAPLANPDGRLRPGMKGYAKIDTPSRSLGWILLHRAFERAVKLLHW